MGKTKKLKGKTLTGVVASTKQTQTVIVAVTVRRRHPLYHKAIAKTRRIPAHNDSFELSVGERVKIVETRPLSKTKHFRVAEKIG